MSTFNGLDSFIIIEPQDLIINLCKYDVTLQS